MADQKQGHRDAPTYAGEEHERETSARKDPPSPYHDVRVEDGGLAPQAMPGEGKTPPPARGELEATAGRKIAQERDDHANEAGNAPRTDPRGRGADR